MTAEKTITLFENITVPFGGELDPTYNMKGIWLDYDKVPEDSTVTGNIVAFALHDPDDDDTKYGYVNFYITGGDYDPKKMARITTIDSKEITRTGLIYTDIQFENAIVKLIEEKLGLKDAVMYSEQGMQAVDTVNFDAMENMVNYILEHGKEEEAA